MESFDTSFEYYSAIIDSVFTTQAINQEQDQDLQLTQDQNWNTWEAGFEDNSFSAKHRSHANARERYRTHRSESHHSNQVSGCSVNSAFTTLRHLIPTEPKNRKLSKIETLRLAKSYIAHLNAILVTDGLIKQPCLKRNHRSGNGNDQQKALMIGRTDASGSNNKCDNQRNICTFCVSLKKGEK